MKNKKENLLIFLIFVLMVSAFLIIEGTYLLIGVSVMLIVMCFLMALGLRTLMIDFDEVEEREMW